LRKYFKENREKWREMLLKDRALWESYAQQINEGEKKIGGLLRNEFKGKLTGSSAYCAINQLLYITNFKDIDKPPHYLMKDPPSPLSDIQHMGTYKGKIKFKIWLPYEYQQKTKAQIAIKTTETLSYIYIIRPAPEISHIPTEIKIDKIKILRKKKKGSKMVELPLKEIKHPIIQIQMRTIAQNGKFSLHSPIYKIEVINP
jgi:hypothetical protein